MEATLSSLIPIIVTIYTLDGSFSQLTLWRGNTIECLRKMLAESLKTDEYLIEIFEKDSEDKLLDSHELLKDCSLFVMFSRLLCWVGKGNNITLSNKSLVATYTKEIEDYNQIEPRVTAGQLLMNGVHYYEVMENNKSSSSEFMSAFVGFLNLIPDPDKERTYLPIDYNKCHNSTEGYMIHSRHGSLWGPKNYRTDAQCNLLRLGDRLGILVNLDEGWIRFYRNGKPYSGRFDNVKPPIIFSGILTELGSSLTIIQDPEWPSI